MKPDASAGDSVRTIRASILAAGRSITPTEKLRIAHKEPFYMSAKERELSSNTLSLSGLTEEDVERISAQVAADAAAAAAKRRNQTGRKKADSRRFATINPGEVNMQKQLMHLAAAAARAERGIAEVSEERVMNEKLENSKRMSVAWFPGRSGEGLVVVMIIIISRITITITTIIRIIIRTTVITNSENFNRFTRLFSRRFCHCQARARPSPHVTRSAAHRHKRISQDVCGSDSLQVFLPRTQRAVV
jgi:hypothetical protein